MLYCQELYSINKPSPCCQQHTVYYNPNTTSPPPYYLNGRHDFLSHLTSPHPHAHFIMSYPAPDGGAGHRDPAVINTIASFAIPLSRSMHYAQEHGILLDQERLLIKPPHNAQAEPIRLYQIFGTAPPNTPNSYSIA